MLMHNGQRHRRACGVIVLQAMILLVLGPYSIRAVDQSARPANENISSGIRDLSNQIYNTMVAEMSKKVAVLPFVTPRQEDDSISYRVTLLGWHISDKLTNLLFTHRDKFEVVDRTHLERLLGELKLSLTGAVDQETAKQLGRLLGADAIVAGTVTDLVEFVDATARVIETERGNVIATASVEFPKSAAVAQLIGDPGAFDVESSQSAHEVTSDNLTGGVKAIRYDLSKEFLQKASFRSGNWSITDDLLPTGKVGSVLRIESTTRQRSYILFGSKNWINYTFECSIKLLTHGRGLDVYCRTVDTANGYMCTYNPSCDNVISYVRNGHAEEIGGWLFDKNCPPIGIWFRFKVICQGDLIQFYKNGEIYREVRHGGFFGGMVGLGANNDGTSISFADLKVTLLP